MFVAGPHEAAVLDVMFPPYNKGNDRECIYYKRRASAEKEEDNGNYDRGNGRQRWPLVALMHIDQPDDFNCLGRSYSCFGLD